MLRNVMVSSLIADTSLYTRLGKMEGLFKIVDNVFENIKFNECLYKIYHKHNLTKLK